MASGHVPDKIYEEGRPHFSEKGLSDLTLAVVAINGWNRMNIAARIVLLLKVIGSFQSKGLGLPQTVRVRDGNLSEQMTMPGVLHP
jgi:hypothetical protein